MQLSWAGEMASRYLGLLAQGLPAILAAALAGGLLVWAWQRAQRPERMQQLASRRRLGLLLTLLALTLGLILAIRQASIFDDAFISFRYASNLLDGHGLVWNPGERVEGYTNFLWTLLLAGAAWLVPLELPLLGLFACLAAYVGCVLVLHRLERRALGATLPLASLLFALQRSVIEYATSGMETAFATLWVLLGLLALLRSTGARAAALAGLALIAATFTRPDHGLFWAAGGLVLLVELRSRRRPGWRQLLPDRDGWRVLASYGASFLPYALYLAWKLQYYGDWLPNTYYAKSADVSYYSQGALYALSFLLGAHLWLLLPLALLGLLAPAADRTQRRLRSFCLLALLAYNLYVIKVGGDFMVGRFYVVTLPLWLLLAHRGLRWLQTRGRYKGILAAALMAAPIGGVGIVEGGPGSWYLSSEASHYRLTSWFPQVAMEHHNWRAADRMRRLLAERGIHPVIATSGIGMVGYYSGLELIDIVGLTDRHVARSALPERRMPGHEKRARQVYLDRRGVQLIRARAYQPRRWSEATTIDLGAHKNKHWHFHRYDAALADQLEQLAPEIGFERFEPQLDRWIQRSGSMSLEELERDGAFFERFYFCCNDDPPRRAGVDSALEEARQRAGSGTIPPGLMVPPFVLSDHPEALLDLLLPASSRPGGEPAPIELPVPGPWEQVWRQGALREYKTRLPVDQVYLGESIKQAPVGMKLLDAEGRQLVYQHRRTALGPEASSWRIVGRDLFLRRPGAAPEPGSIRVRFPRAAAWENGLNLAGSERSESAAALRRTALVNDDQDGLFLPTPGLATWQIQVPPAGVLGLQARILRPGVDAGVRSDGALLVVEVQDGEQRHRLADIPVEPDKAWIPHRVDLQAFAGRSVQLTLRSEPGGDPLLDYLFLAQPTVYTPQSQPRRVVLVFVDTLRRDHLGLYGYQRHPTTPRIDAWAEGAVVFEQARSVAPWTLPSIRALLSAQQPRRWGSSPTLPERLSQQGFATALFCANPYLRPDFDMDRGWSRYRFQLMAPADQQVAHALAWLQLHADRDAALLVQFMDPHLPYDEPAPFRGLWAGERPETFQGALGRESLGALDPEQPDFQAIRRWVEDRYDQNLRFVDAQVGRLLDAVGEDAVVVFFSDHGEEFWDHGGVEHGHSVYEELLAVPLVIKAPSLDAGRIRTPVSLMDVSPTVLAILGIEAPGLQGRSLLPAMADHQAELEALATRSLPFGQTLYGDEAWGVLQGGTKWWTQGASEHLHELSTDPGEQSDLSGAAGQGSERWPQQLAEALDAPVLPIWRIEGQGLRKSTQQRRGSVTLSHPGGFSQAWATPGIRRETAQPQLQGDAAVVTAGGQLRIPREWYVVPASPEASPAGLTLVVDNGERTWRAEYNPEQPGGEPLLRAGEGDFAYVVTRGWAPWLDGPQERELDPETTEQLRALGYVE